ncbi:MAG TPA: SdrD B-like domain-containing protein, partial [Pirellulales bacterium]|nr:SdrD B-like domain-containing protein [Pirellulales bacterium]
GVFQQGDSADTYTITVNNVGPGPTTGLVTVTGTLPTGLTPTAASGTGWNTSIAGQTVTATRSDILANGGSYPALTLTVSVSNNAPASVINTAQVAGGGELNTANDTASDPTTIIPPVADLTLTASHTGAFRQGDVADNYTITVDNIGRGSSAGLVTVTDTLPSGLTPTAASGTGWSTSITGQTVTATRGDVLANSASYPALTLSVSVADNAPASVINTAQVAGGGELNTANDTANDPTTITQVADLTVTASHTGDFRQGDVADNYTITVNNVGPGPTTGQVTVTDALPTGLTPTVASGAGWTTSIAGQTVTATRGDALANGAAYPTLTITVSVAGNAPASVTNTVQVAGGGELNTANDTAADSTTILPPPADLTISNSHTGNFQQGDSADTYTITVSNVGLSPTNGQVTVTDSLPTGLTPTAASGTGWSTSISGSTVTATRSDALANGAAYPALTITVSVAGNAAASVTNTAVVSGGGELNTANDTANDPTAIAPAAGSLSGYVYIDANNDGLRITPQGIRHLAIPGVVVRIFSQDSQGNWTEVAGKSPIQTGQDGSYHFDKLVSGTYRIQVTDFPDFLDGKVTAGAIGGAATGTASEDQIVVQLGAGGNGTEYDFGEMGLRPELISRRMTLASAAPLTQWIVQMIPLPVAQPAQSAEISPASTPLAASAFDALAAIGVPTGYAITANQPLIQAAGASSTGFTFSGAEIGATYRYSITSDGGGAAVTGSGVISAANQAVTGIDVSALPDGTLTFSATLTDATGEGGAVTTTATLDRSAMPTAMPATAAVDSVFGQQSWLQP